MGIFDFFGKRDKKLKEKVDLSLLHTDVHSHLIPGIDDGSPDMATSLAMLRELERLGYKKIITTPHIKAEIYETDVNDLEAMCDKLRSAAKAEGIGLEIEVGAEHLLDEGIRQRLKDNLFKTFCGKHLLIELPFLEAPMGFKDYLFELQLAGYKLILAHPERYLYWSKDFDKFIELHDQGILFQVNIASFSGYYGEPSLRLAKKFADNDMIELLGTDVHGQKHIEAIERALTNPTLDELIHSEYIINKEF